MASAQATRAVSVSTSASDRTRVDYHHFYPFEVAAIGPAATVAQPRLSSHGQLRRSEVDSDDFVIALCVLPAGFYVA